MWGSFSLASFNQSVLCMNVVYQTVFFPFSEVESEVTEVKAENGLEDLRPSTGERIS